MDSSGDEKLAELLRRFREEDAARDALMLDYFRYLQSLLTKDSHKAEAEEILNDEGPYIAVALVLTSFITDKKAVPPELPVRHKHLGQTLMANDPMFMDDYYEDLVRLVA